MPTTCRDVITDALIDLSVYGIEPVDADDADLALRRLNRLFDTWNAEHGLAYATLFSTFTLTPSLNPHTIGPSGATWTLSQRPVSLEGAVIVVSGLRTQVRIHDEQEWLRVQSPSFAASMPSDLYYNPTWPNGSIYFSPVPSVASTVELMSRIVLGSLGLDDVFTMPPGYQEAVTLTLAEKLAPAFHVPVPPEITRAAARARSRIGMNNVRPPNVETRDSGMPSGDAAGFNWETRQ